MSAKYDTIGLDYARLRKPDARIASQVEAALGSARSVVNIGAGTGSYEPAGRHVIAVEPSREMIRKRDPAAAAVVQAGAENLPFGDLCFEAAMAILTVHHWRDLAAGLREMRRVARGRIVLLTFDPAHLPWPTEYFPELAALDEKQMPAMAEYARWLGPVRIEPVRVPHDCQDGFLYAYWRRPAAYLDARIRSGSSSFWAIGNVDAGLARLRGDLESGEWARRHADLLDQDSYDAGYRLVVVE
jgi:SAM-dependent methyltransferase